MGTTSPDLIYWPADPNQPADVINDMQKAAASTQTALNAHMDVAPVSQALSLSSGWAADSVNGYGGPTADRFGRLVTARGLFVRTGTDLTVTDNEAFQVGTIPDGFRPMANLRAHASWYGFAGGGVGNNTSVALLSIFTGGNISFTPNFSGQIRVGQWISLSGVQWVTP